MKLSILHRTHYSYVTAVQDSTNEARLQPGDTAAQRRHSFLLKVLPPTRLSHYLDFYFNCVHMFELSRPHTELSIVATSVVTTRNDSILPLDATVAPWSGKPACARMDRCYDFLQPSTFVNDSVES